MWRGRRLALGCHLTRTAGKDDIMITEMARQYVFIHSISYVQMIFILVSRFCNRIIGGVGDDKTSLHQFMLDFGAYAISMIQEADDRA